MTPEKLKQIRIECKGDKVEDLTMLYLLSVVTQNTITDVQEDTELNQKKYKSCLINAEYQTAKFIEDGRNGLDKAQDKDVPVLYDIMLHNFIKIVGAITKDDLLYPLDKEIDKSKMPRLFRAKKGRRHNPSPNNNTGTHKLP